jgi:hypothetical protein
MNAYAAARRHTLLMLANTMFGFLFIVITDRYLGHSTIAFAIVIVILFLFNLGLWKHNCPRCGSNLFMRGRLPLPWPNRHCSDCSLPLDKVPPVR